MSRLLLCTDMDRTVIPNGAQPEADDARVKFNAFCQQPTVTLTYVTGRHLDLMQSAVDEYALPQADYAITDVGTRIYHRVDHDWQALKSWEEEIDKDWHAVDAVQIQQALIGMNSAHAIQGLTLQEPEKQNPHKISFYVDLNELDEQTCLQKAQQALQGFDAEFNLIWSIDETTDTGLLDILPPGANKLHAILFLQNYLKYSAKEVVFAGDSGNDLQVLVSPVQSVLVANATPALKNQALSLATQSGTQEQFYQAQNFEQSDGNYSAGVLQGVMHYLPDFNSTELK